MIEFDTALSPEQVKTLAATDPKSWFTSVRFANAQSPTHPEAHLLDVNNEFKQALVNDWMRRVVPNRKVLDTFCANGAFSFEAAKLGAQSVVGVDFEEARIETANLVTSLLAEAGSPVEVGFGQADAYRLAERFPEPFDVVLCLGGLYHIADPPYVLRQLRQVTREWMIVQTSNVLPFPGNFARFEVRADRTADGLSSIRGGSGVWHCTATCFREILRHGGFEVVDERRPPLNKLRRFPWYAALARPI